MGNENMLYFVLLAGLASAQIQVPHGPVPTPPQLPQPAALYGPAPRNAAQSVPTAPGGGRRSDNLFLAHSPYDSYFTNPGFINQGYQVAAGYPGFYAGYGLSPQQNGDGTWNFVALPIPLENQTIPEGFPSDQVAQAKIWGPVYKEGQGWVYGEAGTILVPKYPPYAPPRYVTPPALQNSGSSPSPPSPPPGNEDKAPLAEGTVAVDTKTGRPIDSRKAENSRIKAERLRKKPRK